MIALDTNVLVRFLAADDAAQHRRVVAAFERALKAGEQLYISHLVLCETVWVMRFSYKASRAQSTAVLAQLLKATQLTFEAPDVLEHAVRAFQSGRGDFADYLIQARARAAGCARVLTFDRALLKEDGFVAP